MGEKFVNAELKNFKVRYRSWVSAINAERSGKSEQFMQRKKFGKIVIIVEKSRGRGGGSVRR